ncbi:hypothetical protein JP0120_08570 [Helicobacter pylori]|nr:hypothetical protein JP0120_08570 [Helicobacter pylori]
MKKSFKKLGVVSLATSSVLLGSMNATDLETYAALQKPSHVFGNVAVKKESKEGDQSPNPQTPPTKEESKKPLVANQIHKPHQLKRSPKNR